MGRSLSTDGLLINITFIIESTTSMTMVVEFQVCGSFSRDRCVFAREGGGALDCHTSK